MIWDASALTLDGPHLCAPMKLGSPIKPLTAEFCGSPAHPALMYFKPARDLLPRFQPLS